MSKINSAELVYFLKNEEGWDKDTIVYNYCQEVLRETEADTDEPDAVGLVFETEFNVLDEFARLLFDKFIDGVCNVIESFEKETK